MPMDTYSAQEPHLHDRDPPGNTREVTRFGPPSDVLRVATASYYMHAAPPYGHRWRPAAPPHAQGAETTSQLTRMPSPMPQWCT